MRTLTLPLLAALALSAIPAPVALAGRSTTCLARNVTQGTSSTSFRVVVTLAHDGDRLQVRGTCRTRGIAIDKDLVIRGMGERATLTGQARYRVLRIKHGAVVTLRDLVLTHGFPPSYLGGQTLPGGGAISNRGTLTLIDSLVTENEAYFGGGIYNIGTLTLIRTKVVGHGNGYPGGEGGTIQGMGGGIYNTGTATLDHSRVSDNHTDYDGGGIKNTGTMTLRDSRVAGNSSDFGAPGGAGPGSGGIVNSGTLILVDSSVSGNYGATGGGIGNTGTVRLTRSNVSGNVAAYGGGGGIFNGRRGTVILRGGSVVTGNSSGSDSGGGIRNRPSGTVTLHGSSSVTGNTPDDCFGTPAC